MHLSFISFLGGVDAAFLIVQYTALGYQAHATKMLRHARVALPSVTPRDLRGYRATAAVTPPRHEALCCDVTRDSVNVNQGGQRQHRNTHTHTHIHTHARTQARTVGIAQRGEAGSSPAAAIPRQRQR